MNTLSKILSCCAAIAVLSGCTTQWQTTHKQDEFTGDTSCLVEFGSDNQRNFVRAWQKTPFTIMFFAENRDGQPRAGLRSEPLIPLSGDVQIKVGETLYTLTSNDVPLDLAPSLATVDTSDPQLAKTMANMGQSIQKLSSPYRAYTDKKAEKLLNDIIHTGGDIKYRIIGVNAALSQTGQFAVTDDFRQALKDCDLIKE